MPEQQTSLAERLLGTWWLIDRIDRAADGSLRSEPSLGSDPLAMLTYTSNRFAAQFMRRNRGVATGDVLAGPGAAPSATQNNTSAVDGYDAYFGTYRILDSGVVLHKLDAALSAANIGMEVQRTLTVTDDELTIQLETTTQAGEKVTRTLRWSRLR
jgi:hypothetical protein